MKNRNDISYKIDKENRIVICTIRNCKDIAINRITKYVWSYPGTWDEYFIRDRYVGVARCAEEDEWDEEYGKQLALLRAKRTRCHDINEKIQLCIKRMQKEIKDLQDYAIHEVPTEI